jgi:hypothetical protein
MIRSYILPKAHCSGDSSTDLRLLGLPEEKYVSTNVGGNPNQVIFMQRKRQSSLLVEKKMRVCFMESLPFFSSILATSAAIFSQFVCFVSTLFI